MNEVATGSRMPLSARLQVQGTTCLVAMFLRG